MTHKILDNEDPRKFARQFALYHHYVFWEWQYYYRSSLYHQEARKLKYPPESKDNLLLSYLVRHWSHRMLPDGMRKELFDSERILLSTFSCDLEYKYPETKRFIYHHLMFDTLEVEDQMKLVESKNGLVPIDFRGDIDILALELKVFYYQRMASRSTENEKKLEGALLALLEAKVKKTYGNCSFVQEKQDKPRAIGLFLWDFVFKRCFAHGAKAAAYKEFRRFLDKNKSPSMPTYYALDTLKSHLKSTHEQILTRRMTLMTPSQSK